MPAQLKECVLLGIGLPNAAVPTYLTEQCPIVVNGGTTEPF